MSPPTDINSFSGVKRGIKWTNTVSAGQQRIFTNQTFNGSIHPPE